MAIRWGSYRVKGFHDELIRVGRCASARALCQYLRTQG